MLLRGRPGKRSLSWRSDWPTSASIYVVVVIKPVADGEIFLILLFGAATLSGGILFFTTMRGTKEFYDLMERFEKDVRNLCHSKVVKREPVSDNIPKSVFYTDGIVNELFRAYMMGYAYSKAIHKDGDA